MMTKTTSAKMAFCKQFALVPVIVLALFLFGQKVEAKITQQPAFKQKQYSVIVDTSKVIAAKQDAPTDIIAQYTAILERYPTVTVKDKTYRKTNFTADDRAQLITLYKQMSQVQQKQQQVKFFPVGLPREKLSPSEKRFNSWKDAAQYGVWIDERKVKNAELNNYKASDFDLFFVSKLTKNAIHHNEYHYQINLMTKSYYAQYYKNAKAKEGTYIAMTSPITAK